VDLDRAAAAARRQGTGVSSQQSSDKTVTLSQADYTSLQSLFALLPRLDPILPIVPSLLARLQSLSGLHAAASQVTDGLIKLQDEEKNLGEEAKELLAIVEGVQKGLDQAGKQIMDNWTKVEGKLSDLGTRLQGLQ
jgi:nuclear migration protein JNM1